MGEVPSRLAPPDECRRRTGYALGIAGVKRPRSAEIEGLFH
jgi:hypothetical protein